MKAKLLLLLTFLAAANVDAQQLVLPSSSKIEIQGRVDRSNPKRYRFDFPGVNFTINFKHSKSIAVSFKASKQTFFQAFIDGKPVLGSDGKQAIYTSLNDTTVVLSNKLSTDSHTVTFFKRTENLDNSPSEFMGFILDNNGVCSDIAVAGQQRYMEFLGNSITCAFGSESRNKDSKFEAYTENNYLSYANVLARAFNAKVNVVAHSGRGVVRNYADKNQVSPAYTTLPGIYLRTLDADTASRWDFNSYKPDVVVINLGTNDYSTNPIPDKDEFINGYLNLIGKIRVEYGNNVPIFCIVGPMINEPCYSIVKEMVDIRRTQYKDPQTIFIGIPTSTLDLSKDFGASSHPGGDGQKKMAQMVAPVINTVTGWNYNKEEMFDLKGDQSHYSREQ